MDCRRLFACIFENSKSGKQHFQSESINFWYIGKHSRFRIRMNITVINITSVEILFLDIFVD